ncbi:hypothetical protein ES288_A10G065100v1 [Gossypium darwinii]|uniref:Uncharacterized protein n=2 Tax=Gossypium TaxID=3633 RepID=A0A5D2NLZ3_GOSTO|nr:hypothetical protein ES288_A10G065100v1 [Gossypium darwinii]TYI05118.1 hypothetical protein ES332_A10G065600v1 [Gossypium tomentosum]
MTTKERQQGYAAQVGEGAFGSVANRCIGLVSGRLTISQPEYGFRNWFCKQAPVSLIRSRRFEAGFGSFIFMNLFYPLFWYGLVVALGFSPRLDHRLGVKGGPDDPRLFRSLV